VTLSRRKGALPLRAEATQEFPQELDLEPNRSGRRRKGLVQVMEQDGSDREVVEVAADPVELLLRELRERRRRRARGAARGGGRLLDPVDRGEEGSRGELRLAPARGARIEAEEDRPLVEGSERHREGVDHVAQVAAARGEAVVGEVEDGEGARLARERGDL